MNFQQMLDEHFPNAVSESTFVERTYRMLLDYGFNGPNTIACLSVCRDELTYSLTSKIAAMWGEAFNFSSLGGMLFLGRTGFSAAEHHAPKTDGRERYAYFALPHIAISAGGEIGQCYRSGRSEASGACGALIAFLQEMTSGQVNLELDPDDVEQSLLKQRLFRKLRYGETPDLVTLTKLTHETILEDLERMVALTVNTSHSDYAVLSGVQVHGPAGDNYVWPGRLYALVGGKRHKLAWSD